jgi:hypothetical protein
MNKKKRKRLITNVITIIIILLIIIVLLILKNLNKPTTTEEIAKCIGQNSELYTQLGCHACEAQEEMFGENYQYLNVVDCWYEQETCQERQIEYTPTWIINNEKIVGVQEIETLQDLTGCN